MVFKKALIILLVCMVGHYLYDKYIKIGFSIIEIDIKTFLPNTVIKKYNFKFNKRSVIVYDKFAKIILVLIDKHNIKNKISIQNNQLFIRSQATLKTKTDSIGISVTGEKLHGYMGVWTKNDCYYVDENGSIDMCTK